MTRASFNQGKAPTIACFNKATVPLGVDFAQLVAALQKFVDQYFSPIWSTPAKLVITKGFKRSAWGLAFLDTADVANALGYHDLTPTGLPFAKVFVKTTLLDGQRVSVTASHELGEMLVDPAINMAAEGPDGFYAYETGDAVEALEFGVDGVPMSNFVFPSYFESFHKAGSVPFDYMHQVAHPLQILAGGYMLIYQNGAWRQKFGALPRGTDHDDRTTKRMKRRLLASI